MSGETRDSCRRLRKLSPGSRTTNGACRHGSRTQVLLAAQQLASPTNSFPSFPSRLTKRRLIAWPPCFTSPPTARRPSLSSVRPYVCHVVSNRVWLVWSTLKQITQPFGNRPRPEQSSLPSALILEPGGVVTRRPAFHLPANRCASRRLIRLMEVPGCSTATLFRFAFGAPSLSLRLGKRLGQTVWKPPTRWTRGF